MCGLFCMISKKVTGFTSKEINLFEEGLYADTLRGKDSTGCFSINDLGNVTSIKAALPGYQFMATPEYKQFSTDAYHDAVVLVGHNRSATKGNRIDKNAHPFISGNTILVHNGTLYNHEALAKTETDSEAVAIDLNKNGNIETLEKLEGAFAFIWYNAKEKKLHVSRNDQRPLWIIDHQDFDLIGSEPKMLEWLLSRNLNKEQEAKYFASYNIYSWDLDNLRDSYYKVTEFKKKLPIPYKPPTDFTKNTGTTDPQVLPNLSYREAIKVKIESITKDKNVSHLLCSHEHYKDIVFYVNIYKNYTKSIEDYKVGDFVLAHPYSKTIRGPSTEVYCTLSINSHLLVDIKGTECILDNYKRYECIKCKKAITEKTVEKPWFRVRNRVLKNIYCASCAKSHSILKKYYDLNPK